MIAQKAGPEGAPTVLLYAHHDVQPENDHADWDSPPCEPTERGDRLYGRGAADDKAGIVAHLGARPDLRRRPAGQPGDVHRGRGGGRLRDPASSCSTTYKDRLEADVIVIADSGNWDIGEPALTTSLRGLVRIDVEVRTLTHAVHSGMWGGLVPDSIMALSRLHRQPQRRRRQRRRRRPATPARPPTWSTPRRGCAPSPAPPPASSGSARAPSSSGCGPSPAITITGLDAPKVDGASNTLIPAARAAI